MPSSTKASAPDTSATQLMPPAAPSQEPLRPKEDKTRLLAYEKWEAAGRPFGGDEQFWFEAENELIQREEFE